MAMPCSKNTLSFTLKQPGCLISFFQIRDKMKLMNDKYVLLVEDNPDDVALTKRAFRKCLIQNNLVVTNNGVETLDFLFCRGHYNSRDPLQTPALVLLDLKIPYISGLEVLRQIRNNDDTRSLPVVILTSSVEENDLNESHRLGANNYYRKPINFEEFVDLIRQLCSYWLDCNRFPSV
jgi:two-component system response regulator